MKIRTSQETLPLSYKVKPVSAVRETVAVCCENHMGKQRIHCAGKIQSFLILNLVVHIFTTALKSSICTDLRHLMRLISVFSTM
jgi:hypothetical protein